MPKLVEEGATGWSKVFEQKTYASYKDTKARAEVEVAANKTEAQRARKRRKTNSINFRTPPELKRLAQQLSEHLNLSTSRAVELAIIEYCKSIPALSKTAMVVEKKVLEG